MATNYVTAKYQEIYDVNTVTDSVSIIGIHTPVGNKPRAMLSGFFNQFRKYKYRGCSVVATPAQRLGLNLAQLSVEAGGSGVDPKDVFNPALVRGCHGDNLNAALNSIYRGAFQKEGSSLGKDVHDEDVQPTGGLTWEQMYYRMLQDPSFKKFNLSSGLKLSKLHPLVYNVASAHQILPSADTSSPGSFVRGDPDDGSLGLNDSTRMVISDGENVNSAIFPQIMTNRLQSLGWLDTKQLINPPISNGANPAFTVLPKIFMACIILPPAKSATVVTSLRFIVTHYFEFKEFNTSLTLEGATEYYDWLSIVPPNANAKKLENDTFAVKDGDVELISDGTL